MNTIDFVLSHGKRCPTCVGYVLTRVKVHKGVVSMAVSGVVDSDGTKGALSYDDVIALLGGLYVRYKLDLTVLV